jgi:hypothetical protein
MQDGSGTLLLQTYRRSRSNGAAEPAKHGTTAANKATKSVARIVFFSLEAGGQKGFRRSSRKHMNPLAQKFGFCWFTQYTF